MTVEELKARVEKHRDKLNARTKSSIARADEKGPVGIAMIDLLVEMIETQQKQIDELRAAKPR
jgi:hypothetical protein